METGAEQMRAEAELLSSEKRYRAITGNAAEAVMVVQAAKIVFANDNFVCMFGYPSTGDVVGKDLGCLHCPDFMIHFGMEDDGIESGNSNKRVFKTLCTSLDRALFRKTQKFEMK